MIKRLVTLRMTGSFCIMVMMAVIEPAVIKLQGEFDPDTLSVLLGVPTVLGLMAPVIVRKFDEKRRLWTPLLIDLIQIVVSCALLGMRKLTAYVVFSMICTSTNGILYAIRYETLTELMKAHVDISRFKADMMSVGSAGSIVGYLLGCVLYKYFQLQHILIGVELFALVQILLISVPINRLTQKL